MPMVDILYCVYILASLPFCPNPLTFVIVQYTFPHRIIILCNGPMSCFQMSRFILCPGLFCVEKLAIPSGFPSPRASNMDVWWLLYCYPSNLSKHSGTSADLRCLNVHVTSVWYLIISVLVVRVGICQNSHDNMYMCSDGSGCFNPSRWCDGRIDCNDGSDENAYVCGNRPTGEVDWWWKHLHLYICGNQATGEMDWWWKHLHLW